MISFFKKILKLKYVLLGFWINTHLIDSEALDINAVQGTIGGNVISEDGISGAKFSIIDGVLTAEDANISGTITANAGNIGGNVISEDGITGLKWSVIDGVLTAEDADFANITVDGIIAENAYIDGLEVINATIDDAVITNATIDNVTITDATITGSFTSTSAKSTINDSGISFNDGLGGSVGMIAESSGVGLVATDGTDTMVFAGGGIFMSVGGSFYEGLTTTKVAGGVTFQFVNGVLVL